MNTPTIPEPIATAVASMLAPYRPGLTPQRLEAALDFPEEKPPPENLRSRKEAMLDLHVSMPTLDRMLASNELGKVKVRGRVFIRESEIREIIEGTTSTAATGSVDFKATGMLVKTTETGARL